MKIQKYSDLLHDELYNTGHHWCQLLYTNKPVGGLTHWFIYHNQTNRWMTKVRVGSEEEWKCISAGFQHHSLLIKMTNIQSKCNERGPATAPALLILCLPALPLFMNLSTQSFTICPVSSNVQTAWTATTHHSFLLVKNINISCVKKYHRWFIFFEYK